MGPVRLIKCLCVWRSLYHSPPPVDFTLVSNEACARVLGAVHYVQTAVLQVQLVCKMDVFGFQEDYMSAARTCR